MASVRPRAGNWRVLYRLGGGRAGPQQSRSYGSESLANRVAEIAEAYNHDITIDAIEVTIGLRPDPSSTTGQESGLPTLAKWVDTWLNTRTRITPATAATYRGQFDRQILPFTTGDGRTLGDTHLDHITGVDVSRLLTTLQAKFTPATVTRYYSALHACLAYAVLDGKLATNPARRTDFVRDLIAHDDASDEGDGHEYLSMWQYELILRHLNPDALPLVEFLAGTGARISEALAIAVDKFDPMARPRPAVRIHRAFKNDGHGKRELGPTKGRRRRTVPIDDAVVDVLLPLAAGEPGDAFLFRAPRGRLARIRGTSSQTLTVPTPVDYDNFRRRRWEPAVAAAMRCKLHPPETAGRQVAADDLAGPRCGDNGGLSQAGQPCGSRVIPGWNRCRPHLTPPPNAVSDCDCPTRLRRRPTIHDLRHSHVAWLIAEGVPIVAISRRIGHHSITITERVYAGILPELDEATVDALTAARRRSRPATTGRAEGAQAGVNR